MTSEFAANPADFGLEEDDILHEMQNAINGPDKTPAYCEECFEHVTDAESDLENMDCPHCDNRMCVHSILRIMGVT